MVEKSEAEVREEGFTATEVFVAKVDRQLNSQRLWGYWKIASEDELETLERARQTVAEEEARLLAATRLSRG